MIIRTVVTPTNNTLHLSIPNNYVGKEIEVLLYAKDDLLEEKGEKANASRYKGLLTGEEADKFQAYLKQARNQWDRDI